jgi:hypothetical protein
MGKINRRQFIEKSAIALSGFSILKGPFMTPDYKGTVKQGSGSVRLVIPMPLQIVIDDVGWWSGKDGSKNQEPYRTGINRNHVPGDYLAIAELGRKLNVRPQAAMILCEWDRENILRNLPSATWMGKKWDNSKWIGPWFEEAADIIRANRDHFEITIHGVGHEYWEAGTFTRAEWTDSNGVMRPPDQVEKHLEYYGKLLDQHGLGPLPRSFVPAAFRHCFGISEGRKISLASILEKYGINYINTPFRIMYNNSSVQNGLFGFDSGVMTIDRGEDEFEWDVFPAYPVSAHGGPTYGLHWPNMLHPDPSRNPEVVERWAAYFRRYNEKPDFILASDPVELQQQLAHRQLTIAKLVNDTIEFDFSETDKLPRMVDKRKFTFKVISDKQLTFNAINLKIISESLFDSNGSQQYTLKLERENIQKNSYLKVGLNQEISTGAGDRI